MLAIVKFLQGKKTYIVCAVTFLYAVVYKGWQQHDWSDATNLILQSSGGASLRAAVAKALVKS